MCLTADLNHNPTLRCCCGQDCTQCIIYRATVREDEDLRARAKALYRDILGRDLPLEKFYCLGVFSDTVFPLCGECPWVACCKERGVAACEECPNFPCPEIREYREKYVNRPSELWGIAQSDAVKQDEERKQR